MKKGNDIWLAVDSTTRKILGEATDAMVEDYVIGQPLFARKSGTGKWIVADEGDHTHTVLLKRYLIGDKW